MAVEFLNHTIAAFPNGTLIDPNTMDPNACNLTICPLQVILSNGTTFEIANLDYIPSLGGNAIYMGVFGLALACQAGFGYWYKTYGFAAGMLGGLLIELLGYAGRLEMRSNPFTQGPFIMYLVCLTIGPAFLSAAIYLCLARIVVVYGEHLSRFKPRTYTLTFITCDFVALLLQAAGGAIASSSNTESSNQMGINIMIAGLSWQVVSLCVFSTLALDFAWKVRSSPYSVGETFAPLVETFRFKAFLCTLALATVCIFVRSCFRVAELSQGFNGTLANNQITFMILEGAMICIAVIALTVFHPGIAFKGAWADASWSMRAKKVQKLDSDSGSSKWNMPRMSMPRMPRMPSVPYFGRGRRAEEEEEAKFEMARTLVMERPVSATSVQYGRDV